jgi:rhodanese-related sulfurtransferase
MWSNFVRAILVMGVALSSCAALPTVPPSPNAIAGTQVVSARRSYQDVDPAQLKTMLANKDFLLINVHVPFEGNIAQTDQSIAYDAIELNADQLPSDKSTKIVLYCRSGRMSAEAAQTLVALGYDNVWNLAGGMNAWQSAGYSLERR